MSERSFIKLNGVIDYGEPYYYGVHTDRRGNG